MGLALRVHRRPAGTYRSGRVLLAGDAAHIHNGERGLLHDVRELLAPGEHEIALVGQPHGAVQQETAVLQYMDARQRVTDRLARVRIHRGFLEEQHVARLRIGHVPEDGRLVLQDGLHGLVLAAVAAICGRRTGRRGSGRQECEDSAGRWAGSARSPPRRAGVRRGHAGGCDCRRAERARLPQPSEHHAWSRLRARKNMPQLGA
ncbi:FAD-dependent monooxygenase [Streptomyces sp. A3M-1-3]|uniref:FAD-dependent monooxygenase n=1 Tax=Streptomyces sp. A3M-1-3 TaxID=2962044 RepID=UPI0035ABE986